MKTVAINAKKIVARLSEGNISLSRGCYAMQEKQDSRYEKLRNVRFSERKGK